MSIVDESLLCLSNEIETEEFGILYIPTVKEVLQMGEKKFEALLNPYILTKEYIEETYNEVLTTDNMFEYYLQNMQDEDKGIYMYLFAESLKMFFRTEDIRHKTIETSGEIIDLIFLNENKVVHRDNFEQLAEIIRTITYTQKVKLEEKPQFKSEAQRKLYEKINGHRRRHAEEERIKTKDIINIIRHGGRSIISYEEIGKLSYYQFMNDYNVIINQINHDMQKINFSLPILGGDVEMPKSWVENIRSTSDNNK